MPERQQHKSGPDIPEKQLPSDTTEWKVAKFRLNTNKALNKKLKAADRDSEYALEEAGEGLTVICQAGLYELLRRASCQYYASFNVAGLRSQATVQTDQDSSITQVSFRIKTYGGQSSYTLDLYHTKSSIRLTGRSRQKFIDTDWHQIASIIQEMNDMRPTTDSATLNYNIQTCLKSILMNNSTNRAPKCKGRGQVMGTTEQDTCQKTHGGTLGLDRVPTSPAVKGMASPGTSKAKEPTPRHQAFPYQGDGNLISTSNAALSSLMKTNTPADVYSPLRSPIRVGTPPHSSDLHNCTTENMRYPQSLPWITPALPDNSIVPSLHPDHDKRIQAFDDPSPTPIGNPGYRATHPNHNMNSQTAARADTSQRECTGDTHTLHHSFTELTSQCNSCEELGMELKLREKEIEQMKKKAKLQEKAINQREQDLRTKALQYANSKAHIEALESQIKQLQESNRILNDRLASQPYPSPTAGHNTTATPAQADTSTATEHRMRQIENQLQDIRFTQLEMKLNQMQLQLNNSTPQSPPQHQVHHPQYDHARHNRMPADRPGNWTEGTPPTGLNYLAQNRQHSWEQPPQHIPYQNFYATNRNHQYGYPYSVPLQNHWRPTVAGQPLFYRTPTEEPDHCYPQRAHQSQPTSHQTANGARAKYQEKPPNPEPSENGKWSRHHTALNDLDQTPGNTEDQNVERQTE